MGKDKTKKGGTSGPRAWSWEKKLTVVAEAARLGDEELGAFLRREGVHEPQLIEWRAQMQAALAPKSRRGQRRSPEVLENLALKRDLERKNRALAEVTALLALSKKVQELWGDEDSVARTNSGS
jgi:transposase-like protein